MMSPDGASSSSRLIAPTAVVCGVLGAADSASAHLVTSGAGPFYDGVAHVLVSPDDLVVVIALGMLGGLSGRRAAKRLVLALPTAWLIGAALGLFVTGNVATSGISDWLPAVTVLVAGLLVAINPGTPVFVPAVVSTAFGMIHGWLNGCAMAATQTSFLAAVGVVSAVAVLVLLLSAGVSSLRTDWQIIAVRTLGSWAAAFGLLALAWALQPP